MKVSVLLTMALLALVGYAHAQNNFPHYGRVSVGTKYAHPSSLFEVRSSHKGVLIPRMTAIQRRAIQQPATGLLVFQTDGNAGLYYYKQGWKPVAAEGGANRKLSNLIGMTEINAALIPRENSKYDLGHGALSWKDLYIAGDMFIGGTRFMSASNGANLFLGHGAGDNTTTGSANVALGNHTLTQNATGGSNTAIGWQALHNNISGEANVAVGLNALVSNLTGQWNTALGLAPMLLNTSGFNNIAIGAYPLSENTSGGNNIAIGYIALGNNTEGYDNIAVGSGALGRNTTGGANTAVGSSSLLDVNTYLNTSLGYASGYFNASPTECTFVGAFADANDFATNSVALGYEARALESNQVMVGNTSITSIGGYANWTNFSDGRFKQNVKEDVPGIEFINMLRPVTYTLDLNGVNESINMTRARSDKGLPPMGPEKNAHLASKPTKPGHPSVSAADQAAVAQKSAVVFTGFIAQEVEESAKKLNFDFSGVDAPQDKNGFYGLRYGDFVVPLVRAVQEISKKIEEQNKELAEKNELLEQRLHKLEAIVSRLEPGAVSGAAAGYLERISPNPVSSTSLLRYYVPGEARMSKIMLTDAKGSVVGSYNTGKGRGQIRISRGNLAAGVYNLTLWIDGALVDSQQVVVSR